MKKRLGGLSLDIHKADEVMLQELASPPKQAEPPAKRSHLELTKIDEGLYLSSNAALLDRIARLGIGDEL